MTTLPRLAETLHYMLGMDTTAAEEALRGYLQQVERMDDRTIDEDNISDDDAEALIGAAKAARRAGSLGDKELATVEESAARYQDATTTADDCRAERDHCIHRALAAGASKRAVARAAGISVQAVSKIAR